MSPSIRSRRRRQGHSADAVRGDEEVVRRRRLREARVEADEGRRTCFETEREVQRVESAQRLVTRRQQDAFRASMDGRRQLRPPEGGCEIGCRPHEPPCRCRADEAFAHATTQGGRHLR